MFDLHSYDKYVLSFSGGKDSSCLLLYLLENKIPRSRIELWHQDIDGRDATFFDWEITPDYCRRFAEAFGVKIYFQWKEGGFRRELLRENALTAPVCYELPEGTIGRNGGTRGKLSTRRKFPQTSADLKTRWCSSYLKIDVCSSAIINQDRFRGIRTLVLSGERGEESPQRAKYAIWEPDRADLRDGKQFSRHVDRHRPIRDWTQAEVWAMLEKYRVRAHPCYYMGWSRCSCKFCIFGNRTQFASAAKVSPGLMQQVVALEREFGCTLKRNTDLQSLIDAGTPYQTITEELKALATQYRYDLPILITQDEPWILPAGAFGENCGAM